MSKTYRVTAWRADSEKQIAKINMSDLNSEHMAEVQSVEAQEDKAIINLSFSFADTFIQNRLKNAECGFILFVCPTDINNSEVQINIIGNALTYNATLYDVENKIYSDNILKGRLCVIKFLDNCYLLNV